MSNPFSLGSEMGIRKRVFFLLVVIFVPLLFLHGLTFYRWYRESKKAEIQANLELARTVSKTFDSFINDVLHTQLAIGLAATASPPPSSDSLRRILQGAEETNPMLRSFTWSSPAGVSIVATDTAVKNAKIRAQALVPRIVSGEEYGVSDLHDSPNTGEKVFVIGRGIRDPRGNLLGIVSCVCIADKLDPLLAVQRSTDTAISLLDSKGTHVYRYPALNYMPEETNRLRRQPVIQNALEGKDAAVEVHGWRDERRLAAFVPIPSIGWVAASSRAEDEVMASITRTLLPQALFILLVTLAAFGAAVILSRPISTSIRRLQDHAAVLGQGDVEKFEMVLGPREIKSLSEALNEMAEKVRCRERALRKSEQKFRVLFENSPDGVFLTSPDGSIEAANPAAIAMLGYSEEEICRLGRSGLLEQDDPRLSTRLEERQRTGRVRAQELTAIRKSGERFPVEVDSVILPTEPHRAFVIMRDVTERKRAEEELRKSRDELEFRVEERTSELERRNQDLQELTVVASHDLSEPLRKIQTFASLLETRKADLLDERSRDFVARMKQSADRMRDLLDALLRYLRIETEVDGFRLTRLGDVVLEVVGQLEPEIRKTGSQVEIGPLPIVAGDPNQLRELIQNLIANALKYHRSEVKSIIKIRGEKIGDAFSVSVEDNGIGFDEKYLDKIFQPFQRLHRKHEYSGTGIGLAICKKIVDRHGGTITARSTPGKGSTFIFTLPVERKKA